MADPHDTAADPLASGLLGLGLRGSLRADSAEHALEIVTALLGRPIAPARFHAALAALLRAGLIREPVRLPPGALSCHWQLDLTPAGQDAARTIAGS